MENNNIITVPKADSDRCNDAFRELIKKSVSYLNMVSITEPNKYKSASPGELERISTKTIQDCCDGLPFRKEDICLIAGQHFPDIVAKGYYGVEVKSTKYDHWSSTGSSIVESTRIQTVEDIYLLFGKLGGDDPAFMCRPYQEVMYDIAVTHSPRYLINMELPIGQSIFDKMDIPYDELRTSPDSIAKVRHYYQHRAEENGKQEMPWWMNSDDVDKPIGITIKLWKDLDRETKRDLTAKCLILFMDVIGNKHKSTKYNQATLWLCSYCQVVMPNIRDVFSSGGSIYKIDDHPVEAPIPQVCKTIVENSARIKTLLEGPDSEMLSLIKEFNPSLLEKGNSLYNNWLNACAFICSQYGADIKQWIAKPPTFTLSKIE